MYHRFAHLNKISVKRGDKIKRGDLIGEVGNTGGNWTAHLHYDILRNQPSRYTEYTNSWVRDMVKEAYIKPHKYVDMEIPTKYSHLGYDWLDWNGKGFHPGIDINGPGGGNSDLGNPVYSTVKGTVVYTNNVSGWGNLVVIREEKEDLSYGLDISHWNKVTDWDKVDADFIICKCTQGTGYVDPTYKDNKKAIRKKGIVFGAYHFADGDDVQTEAKHFLENVGALYPSDILVLDWEIEHKDPVLWCNKFLKIIEEKTGIKPYWYTNDARGIKYDAGIPYLKWKARYRDYTGEFYWEYEPRSEWDIWQYTSRAKVDGIEGNVDRNVSRLKFEVKEPENTTRPDIEIVPDIPDVVPEPPKIEPTPEPESDLKALARWVVDKLIALIKFFK